MSRHLSWFKSSYSGSGGGGGDCLEVAVSWEKSSYSGPDGGDCVEVGRCAEAVHVRDSKRTAGPHLTLTPDAWAAFVQLARQS
ncbi:DUF397 domain-containing protein [Streptomyces sp. 549]|uniref:DUF397 domain-containing protein n=1 Tax=Streptomyces sp. 549 TaxID=3049076 RepID=UPI0024C26FA1|nr:DUF397 domain-containing protein [Streptomyces sp. 549]MDK1475437.1 DUF397 domain-containing protein [Streptomyces sp. 549]